MVRTLRRYIAVTLIVVAASLLGLQPISAADFSFTGVGWGHGVGLSQYGAKALGADGADYEQILARYFTGVSIVPLSVASQGTFVTTDPTPLWVGLRQDTNYTSFTVETAQARLCFDHGGACVANVRPGENFRFGPDGAEGCVFLRLATTGTTEVVGAPGSCNASVRPLSSMTTVNVPVKARSYRHGTLRFRQAPDSKKVHVVYEISVEGYMRGLSEVPETWPTAAIEAQVVASRSSAVWHALDRGGEGTLSSQRKNDCFCNLRDDTLDQIFRGWTGEATHPNWVAAVVSTSEKVIASGANVALGLYSSSSGGTTENYSDVFGGSNHPYLASANDSAAFSDSAANPHARWAAGYNQSTLANVFGFSWLSDAEVTERNHSGSARTVRLTGIIAGLPSELTVTGAEIRSSLSLRSTAFEISVTPRFSDVKIDNQFAGEILGLHTLGITTGCAPTTFCPGRAVTRAEMAAFLGRALNLPASPGPVPFDDSSEHPLQAAIGALAASGITTGCTPTTFCPDRAVTRGEMAAFLIRVLD
jgi:SpoIID/LytB domain protein